jgi:hypothetical protein
MEHFLQDIDEVRNFISSIFTKVCPAVADQVSSVDPAIRLWDAITFDVLECNNYQQSACG